MSKDSLDCNLDSLLGKNNWVAYCINLDIAIERKKNFSHWANSIGLTFNYWSATNKNTLSDSDYKECDVIVNNEFKSPGATACRLSHIRLFKYLLEKYPSFDYFFVFEDDCGFKTTSQTEFNKKTEELSRYLNNVKVYNTNWDMLLFGYHDTGAKQLFPITNDLNYVVKSHLAHATIYKRTALENLIYLHHLPDTRSLPFDWITDILRSLKAISIGPNNSIIEQVDDFSYILFNYENEKKEKSTDSVVEDLMRCCVQFPKKINDKIEFNLNINTLYGDAIFLPHSSIKSFVRNARFLKNPVVLVAYDENNKVDLDTLNSIEKENNIIAIYINSPVYKSSKIVEINIKENDSIVYWKKLIDSHKMR